MFRIRRLSFLAVVLGLVSVPMREMVAQGAELTPFIAYRFANNLANGRIEGGAAYGATLSIPSVRPELRYEIFYSISPTTGSIRVLGADPVFDVNVSFLGVGRALEIERGERVRVTLASHLLWTHLSTRRDAIDRLGIGFAFGTKIGLGEASALTGGYRLVATLADAGTGIGCGVGTGGAGCSLGFSGDAIFTSEFSAGLSFELGKRR